MGLLGSRAGSDIETCLWCDSGKGGPVGTLGAIDTLGFLLSDVDFGSSTLVTAGDGSSGAARIALGIDRTTLLFTSLLTEESDDLFLFLSFILKPVDKESSKSFCICSLLGFLIEFDEDSDGGSSSKSSGGNSSSV